LIVLDEAHTHRGLIHQFLNALGALPNIRLEPPRWNVRRSNFDLDAEIDLHISDKLVRLSIEAKTILYPRDVREILWRLRPYSKPLVQNADAILSVLVADSISPGAKDLLKAEHIGYYDRGGSLYLPASGAYIYIDKPPPKAFAQSLGSLYSGVRAQVLHALLHHYREWVGGQELAARAQVSTATASQVLMELERLELVESRGQGPHKERHVVQPGALLDSWVKHLALKRAPVLRRYFVPSLKTESWEPLPQLFAVQAVEYAISFEAAAQHYAPFLSSISQVRMRALVGGATHAALAALNVREVSEGANLALIDAKSSGEFLFREQTDGLWWANPVQVYLDLQRGEGRSKEMAEHLRRERIGF
jgi:DNA-binding transcriptional ArsR family regulator